MMKLINFQIKNYNVIADTEPVKVDPKDAETSPTMKVWRKMLDKLFEQ